MYKMYLPCVLFGCLLMACDSDVKIEAMSEGSPDTPSVISVVPAFTEGSMLGELRLPDNSSIVLSDDGSSVTIEFPEGIYFVREDEEGNPSLQRTITYTCTCSSTGAGTVAYVAGDFGCFHGGCTGSCNGAFMDDRGHRTDALVGGFVDLNQNATFLKSVEESEGLLAFDPIILALPEVEGGRVLLSLHHLAVLMGGYEGPSRVLGANFYGTLVGISLPESYIATLSDAELLRTVTCNCGSGNSGCAVNQNAGSFATCVGSGYSSCSMIVVDDGHVTH